MVDLKKYPNVDLVPFPSWGYKAQVLGLFVVQTGERLVGGRENWIDVFLGKLKKSTEGRDCAAVSNVWWAVSNGGKNGKGHCSPQKHCKDDCMRIPQNPKRLDYSHEVIRFFFFSILPKIYNKIYTIYIKNELKPSELSCSILSALPGTKS